MGFSTKKPIGNLFEVVFEENIKRKLFSSMRDKTSDKSFYDVYFKILVPISTQILFQNTESVKYNINL